MTERYNAILGQEKEEERKERAELSNFLRYSESTFNWMRSTIQTGVKNLQEDGVSKKDLQIFLEETLEQAWKDEDEELSDEAVKAVKNIQKDTETLRQQGGKEEKLGRKIDAEIEGFLENFKQRDGL